MSDGLKCPVAGDHKFGGHLFRTDPRLKRKVKIMQLEKDKLYLHAKLVEIPGYHGERNPPLVIQAPLPMYYKKAIRQLGFNINIYNNL